MQKPSILKFLKSFTKSYTRVKRSSEGTSYYILTGMWSREIFRATSDSQSPKFWKKNENQ